MDNKCTESMTKFLVKYPIRIGNRDTEVCHANKLFVCFFCLFSTKLFGQKHEVQSKHSVSN